MLGHKSVGSHFLGYKSLALGGIGHKSEPHSQTTSVKTLQKEPEIHNSSNSSKSQQQPIKKFIKSF